MKLIGSIIIIFVVFGIGLYMIKNAPATNPIENDQETSMNTEESLKIETITPGTGEEAKVGDTVQMNYTGRLVDGTAFDSNVDPQFQHVEPFEFTLGENRVIQGWEKGVLGMKVGEKRTLTIGPELGYGDRDLGVIPPNSTLIFDVELIAIK